MSDLITLSFKHAPTAPAAGGGLPGSRLAMPQGGGARMRYPTIPQFKQSVDERAWYILYLESGDYMFWHFPQCDRSWFGRGPIAFLSENRQEIDLPEGYKVVCEYKEICLARS